MLEPRQADIPVLFLVLVVFPVVAYVLLGKWGEASKRKERINFLAQQAAEESFRAEAMSTPSVIPMASSSGYIPVLSPTIPSVIPVASSQGFVPSQTTFRQCANCHAPSTTRCARCKSVRYCSGKCQIIHWRQGHKEECMPPESNSSSYKCASTEEAHDNRAFNDKDKSAQLQERAPFDVRTPVTNVDASSNTVPVAVDTSRIPKVDRKSAEKRRSRKPTRDSIGREDKSARVSSDGTLGNRDSCSSFSSFNPSKQDSTRPKLRGGCSADPEGGVSESRDMSNPVPSHGHTASRSKVHPNAGFECQSGGLAENGKGGVRHSRDYSAENGDGLKERLSSNEVSEMCSGTVPSNVNVRAKSASHLESTEVPKLPKSRSKASREQAHFGKDRNGHTFDDSIASNGNFIPAQGHDGVTSNKFMKIMGFKKSSKTTREDSSVGGDNYNRVKVLFPYEEFVKFFQCKVYGLVPRGLMNCGNSCYANAVLQCLTCTKPLVMYLLSRTHSRSCCGKNWCLMCELEQHVLMLRETGGPLSPSRILSHMRSINCQIGDGSQEDAHEFLRLLIASMQSICLEEVGGENQVHPSLQETTFVQHTFGGRLRSMVKCSRCRHESERYENIMDLTLEIYGWVESLEDALTQFTTPEDLDGENMYRCGRCASYVRARKQLSIDEAPNILTIVLKRFQEGSYGKINKCITFPEMLDMIPYMTRTNDIPPLYMLYGVVVHVDTLNASFSGHYVSYVKDLQSNWFRIDDSEVQPVPMSQVMSEGAYILFYMRSFPRPPRACIRNTTQEQAPVHKSSKLARRDKHNNCSSIYLDPMEDQTSMAFSRHTSNGILQKANSRFTPMMETYAEANGIEFSDATSSDWSLFTSSDEASFTSESTRDSFSTADYSDTTDPVSSVFNPFYSQEHPTQRTVSCRMFSGSKPLTRYVSEEKGFIVNSHPSAYHLDGAYQAYYPSDSNYQNFVNYGNDPEEGFLQTFSNCQL